MENCEIMKVLKVIETNESYYMQVRFNHCTSKEARENLIKEELINRFPLIRNKTIQIEEYLGKMYNEYKYEIEVKQTEDNLLLNETDGAYLNAVFEKTRKEFNFTSKKVAFLTGSSGKKIGDKKEYFEGERVSLQRGNTHPNLAQLHDADCKSCDSKIIYSFNIPLLSSVAATFL
jgi:hypothetical protein